MNSVLAQMVQDFFRAANAMFGRCKVCKYVPCILDVVSRIFANICIHIYINILLLHKFAQTFY